MQVVLLVIAGVAIVTSVALLFTYNRFVQLRNLIGESWHDIDTELQRRYDLIPNPVETVKGYAAHEQAVFESVTALRTQAMAEPRPFFEVDQAVREAGPPSVDVPGPA